MDVVDMVSSYPDRTVPTSCEDVIATMHQMANEEGTNTIGHLTREQI